MELLFAHALVYPVLCTFCLAPALAFCLALAHHSYAYLCVDGSAERGDLQIRHLLAVVHAADPAFTAHQRAFNYLNFVAGTHHSRRNPDGLGAAMRECVDPRNLFPVQGNKCFILPANQARASSWRDSVERSTSRATAFHGMNRECHRAFHPFLRLRPRNQAANRGIALPCVAALRPQPPGKWPFARFLLSQQGFEPRTTLLPPAFQVFGAAPLQPKAGNNMPKRCNKAYASHGTR